uniref:UDENN domain-containing protein n=1 Tax=Angiostrongylus cantonensis TaxID=6313 RepID=A0A0K0DBE9_ANGCA
MPSGSFVNPMYIIAPSSFNGPQTEMWVHLPDVLEFFFVAHPPSGRCEGEEHKRVMYFYPKGETLDRQTEITGFAEAVVNFTDNFVNPNDNAEKPEFPHRTVLTQKIQCAAAGYSIFLPAIQNVLTDTYKMFRLFFGKFRPFRKNDQQKFTERLEYFFGRYLPLLKLHRMPLLDYLSGAAFLRLDGPTYLNVVTMSSELLEEFPIIQKLLVLYQDKVLYYSLSRRDLPSMFRYLTQSLLPMTIGDELDCQSRLSQGRFLRGPSDLCVDTPLVGHDALPTVFLFNCVEDDDAEELVKYQMMVYRCLNATVCMFTDQEVTRMLMRNIDAYLGSELSTVASQIGD